MFGTLNKVGDLLFPLFSSLSIELNFFSKQKIGPKMTSKFRDSKLKSDERNHLSVKKIYGKTCYMHQNEIVRKLSFQVLMGLLRSFRGHLKSFGDSELKSDKRNRLSVQKNLEKDILHAPK